tara:strand:+ start:350 stop:1270 length:921 start_codon:yes stop_codon:yes gene_type:complete
MRRAKWAGICAGTALFLSGCGGSSSSGETTSESNGRTTLSAPAVTAAVVVSLPENETRVLAVGSSANGLTLSGVIPGVAAEYRDGNLILVASEVDRIVTGTLTLAAGETPASQINVVVENSSAEPIYQRTQALTRQHQLLLALAADKQLYTHLVDLLYLSSRILHADKQTLLREFNPVGQPSYGDFQLTGSQLVAQLDLYERGLVADSQLADALALAEASLATHSLYGQRRLAALEPELADVLPPLSGGSFGYEAAAGYYSRYQSDHQFGQTSADGTWTFSSEYRFLARFDLNSDTSGSCSIQEVL